MEANRRDVKNGCNCALNSTVASGGSGIPRSRAKVTVCDSEDRNAILPGADLPAARVLTTQGTRSKDRKRASPALKARDVTARAKRGPEGRAGLGRTAHQLSPKIETQATSTPCEELRPDLRAAPEHAGSHGNGQRIAQRSSPALKARDVIARAKQAPRAAPAWVESPTTRRLIVTRKQKHLGQRIAKRSSFALKARDVTARAKLAPRAARARVGTPTNKARRSRRRRRAHRARSCVSIFGRLPARTRHR